MGKIKEFFKYFTREEEFEYSNYHNIQFDLDVSACKDMDKEDVIRLLEKAESDKRLLMKDYESLRKQEWNVSFQKYFLAFLCGLSLIFPFLLKDFTFWNYLLSLGLGIVFSAILLMINALLSSRFEWYALNFTARFLYYLFFWLLYPVILYFVFFAN